MVEPNSELPHPADAQSARTAERQMETEDGSRMASQQPREFGIERLFWKFHEALAILDTADGRVALWNPAAEAIFGYTAEEMVGRPLEQLLPAQAREQHRRALAGLCTAKEGASDESSLSLELPALARDRRQLLVEIVLSPLQDGPEQRSYAVALIRDISALRRAEESRAQLIREQAARAEAEAARRQFAFLAEVSAVLASSLDYEATLKSLANLLVPEVADWCMVHVRTSNSQIRRVAMAHVDPEMARLVTEMHSRYPPDPNHPHTVSSLLLSEEPRLYEDIPDELLVAAGRDEQHVAMLRRLKPISALGVPLVVRGETIGALAMLTSESGRRYSPADLALATAVARRAALAIDSARLYHEAQAAVRARNEFLSLVSHDLKNPLVAIKGFAQLLPVMLQGVQHPAIPRVREGLAKIDLAATRMQRLISELVDVSRLETGEPLALLTAPTDLVRLARQLVTEYEMLAGPHTLQLESATDTLVGNWDAARLERVLANLLSNASKYSPAGSTIRLRIREQDGWAVLQVQDQGLGIPAADLSKIFDQFYRASNVRSTAGSGLGLAGVRQIVEQHGGSISVDSEEGAGSTFTVRLPLKHSGS